MKTCICTIIKDENLYLDEWISHHLKLGIDEIFLYEDEGSISHSTITEPYGDKVHLYSINEIKNVKNKQYKGSRNQEKLFDYFPHTYKDVFDWILFIDIDEFLILKQPLHQLLKEYDDKPGILLKWRWYSANGHIKKPEGKVVDNFTKYVTTTFDYYWTYKSFLNCKNWTYWEKPIHKIYGAIFPITDYGIHKAYLNHYFTKSWEEWKIKLLSRGDTFPGHRKIEEFFHLNPDLLPIKEELLSGIYNNMKI